MESDRVKVSTQDLDHIKDLTVTATDRDSTQALLELGLHNVYRLLSKLLDWVMQIWNPLYFI